MEDADPRRWEAWDVANGWQDENGGEEGEAHCSPVRMMEEQAEIEEEEEEQKDEEEEPAPLLRPPLQAAAQGAPGSGPPPPETPAAGRRSGRLMDEDEKGKRGGRGEERGRRGETREEAQHAHALSSMGHARALPTFCGAPAAAGYSIRTA